MPQPPRSLSEYFLPQRWFVFASCLLLVACSDSSEVDARLSGSWQTTLGQWLLTFEPQADGHYRTTFSGPFAPPAETGEMVAADGRWHTRKSTGEEESGSYHFPDNDTVVFQGSQGTLTWRRQKEGMDATTQTIPGLPSSNRLQGDWPLSNVPGIAGTTLRQAREWQPDAILTGISAKLLQTSSPVVHNVDTPAGGVVLSMTFCSPARQRALIISPLDGEGRLMGENPTDCQPEQAIPDDFPDLPAAVRQARNRGMQAEFPREARLVNRIDGVRGEDVVGVAWRIFSTDRQDKTQLIPMQRAAEPTVRVVDACRLIDRADAERVLGGGVEIVPPHYQVAQTYSCHYRREGTRDRSLGLLVDESPARNARQFMQNQRRNRRESVPDLGDEAYLFDSPAGMASLDVRVGETLLQFTLSDAADGRRDNILELGYQAVARLAGGDGVVAEQSPDIRLIGDWLSSHEQWRFLLSVKPDQSLTLSAARVEQLAAGSEANQWQLVDRARRRVKGGELQWLGDERFRTMGDIEAQWQRVPQGANTTTVSSALTIGSGIDSEQPEVGASPWPQLALDNRMPGLWQASGRVDRVDVDLLWRIRADGPSTLLTVSSGRGYVRKVDRWRRVILKFSEELERIGRQLKLDFHDGAIVTGFDDDRTLRMQMHDLRNMRWTRIETGG